VIGKPARRIWSIHQVKQHATFGLRGFWSGLSLEINTRLDVLVVGIFLSDAAVGLYALVAQIAEGFLNVLVVVRNQLAPVLGKLARPMQVESIQKLARTLLVTLMPLAAVCAAIGIWVYAPAVSFLFPTQGYEAGTSLLAILLVGLVLNSWLLVVDTLLIVGGHPGAYSLLMLLTVATNMAANLTLVPMFGLHGAAIATALASVSMGGYFIWISRQRFGFWIIQGRWPFGRHLTS
jgi:O-antigen/teichoic acid export membrane protein